MDTRSLPCCSKLHCTALHCTALHCTALHYNAMQCIAMHCTDLHSTVLHCTSQNTKFYIQFKYFTRFLNIAQLNTETNGTSQTASLHVHTEKAVIAYS